MANRALEPDKDRYIEYELPHALYGVLVENLDQFEEGQETVEYLDQWFTERTIKQEILDILAKYGLGESAIEAEAFRQSAADFMTIDQLLAASESARDRALRNFFLCREALAQQRQKPAIDVTPVSRIEFEQGGQGLTMTSERQIAANRRNAHKSTGPKSRNGKRRSARNARTHGLAEPIAARAEYARLIDELANKIACERPSALERIYARAIAECEVELRRVLCVRIGLIEQARVHAGPEDLLIDRSQPEGSFGSATKNLYHDAEAIRRLLPDLAKISRYERRAAARRDRAVRRLLALPPTL